jgi:AdoMet-dependent heme synthase
MYRENETGLHVLEIELTSRCNLSCRHCYVKSSECDQMELHVAMDLIRQSNTMGVNRIALSGGEPLLHPDIFEIGEYAKTLGIPDVALLTNGVFITEQNVDRLKSFDIVQLSVDMAEDERNLLRKQDLGVLEQAVGLLKNNGISTTLFGTLHSGNFKLSDKFVKFAKHLGVSIAFNKLVPLTGNEKLKQLSLTPFQYKQCLKTINEIKDSSPFVSCSDPLMFAIDGGRWNQQNKDNESITGGCTAGIAALYVTCSGKVFPCPFIDKLCGNIHEQKLKTIWYESKVFQRLRRRVEYSGPCGICRYVNQCGGCRASSFLSTGSLYSSDPNCFILIDKRK